MSDFTSINEIFQLQQKNKKNINSTSASERKEKLEKLLTAIIENQKLLTEAASKDLSRTEIETKIIEIFPLVSEIRYLKRNLKRWLKPKYSIPPITLLGSSGKIEYTPKGQILIISPWNYPILLTLAPVAMAIAAGNCIIVKPSEFCPNLSDIMKNILSEIFNDDEVTVIKGTIKEGKYLISLPFDHIYFTGSSKVGKEIALAAAKNFTSATLELGGKSPAIISNDADFEEAASKIVWGKFINCGQTCIAPDYVLVPSNKVEVFIEQVRNKIEIYYGPLLVILRNSDYGKIITEKHAERLIALINDALSKGAVAETPFNSDSAKRFISPIILSGVNVEMNIMKEEIFGPVLPVISYDSFSELLDVLDKNGNPLSSYIFSHDKEFINRVKKYIVPGSLVINNVVVQYANYKLPFGGVKSSGLGKSHGFYGFKAFSNELPVMNQITPTSAKLLYPPYTNAKQKLIDLMIKYL